jgi:hypothetical protein
MSRLPILVDRKGGKRIIEVRRESNVEVMQTCLNMREKITLRVSIQIKDCHAKFVGYQGVSIFQDVKTIKEAREFIEKLQNFCKQGETK